MSLYVKIIFMYFCIVSCSFLSKGALERERPYLVLDHDATIEIDGVIKEVTKDDKVYFNNTSSPIYLNSPGKIPLIVYPLTNVNSTLNIKLRSLNNSVITETQNQIAAKNLETILLEVQRVQILVLGGDLAGAYQKSQQLRMQYPTIAFLHFIEGNCLHLLGRNNEALAILKQGLEINPTNTEARELYRSLGGVDI